MHTKHVKTDRECVLWFGEERIRARGWFTLKDDLKTNEQPLPERSEKYIRIYSIL